MPDVRNRKSREQDILKPWIPRKAALPVLIYLALSILFSSSFFSWRNLESHSIQGGDPAFNAWILQRATHQLLTDPKNHLDGNVYHPTRNSLTAWDHLTSLAIFNIPLHLLSSSPWLGYNLLIFLAYFISALGGYRLALTLTGNRYAAFWAGIFWGFLFFRAHHFTHLQILSFQWMPYSAEALISFLKTEKTRHLRRFVVFTLLQSLVGWYLAVINGFLLLIVFLFSVGKKNFSKSVISRGLAAFLVMALVMLPFILAYSERKNSVSGEMVISKTSQSGEQILPWDYLHPPEATILGHFLKNTRYSIWGENTLYIGFVPLLLALAGLWFAFREKKALPALPPRRLGALASGLMLTGGVFALGYNSHNLGIPLPWNYVSSLIPPLALIRATPRFSLLVYMGILVLSAVGLYFLLARISSPAKKMLLTGCLSTLFLLEVYPFSLPINPDRPFSYEETEIMISGIREDTGRELIIVHIIPTINTMEREELQKNQHINPIRVSKDSITIRMQLTPRLMLGSTLHWSRMLNGISYLGRPTSHYFAIANMFPDERAVALLRLYDVDLVVMSEIPGLVNEKQLKKMLEAAEQLGDVIPAADGKYILKLDRQEAAHQPIPGTTQLPGPQHPAPPPEAAG